MRLPGIQFERYQHPDGTVAFDVQDEILGRLGWILISSERDGSAHIQVKLDSTEDPFTVERMDRMSWVAFEVARLFEKDLARNTHQ